MRWGADIGKHDGVRRWPTCWGQISSIALGSCIGQHAGSNIDQQVGHRHWPTCWGQTLAAMLGPKNQGNLFIYEATTKNGSTARGCCRQLRTKKLSKGDVFFCAFGFATLFRSRWARSVSPRTHLYTNFLHPVSEPMPREPSIGLLNTRQNPQVLVSILVFTLQSQAQHWPLSLYKGRQPEVN